MRRKDKEITERNIINKIMTVSGVVRLGFFRNGILDIMPVALKNLHDDYFSVSENEYCGEASFQADIYAGIRKGTNICSWTTKYMSVYGSGMLKYGEFFIETISAKSSAMTENEIVLPLRQPTCFIKSTINFADVPVIRLGILFCDEIYIVPINHAEMNGSLYFHSSKEGRKIELLRKNPQIIVEAESYEQESNTINFSLYEATAHFITCPKEKTDAMAAIISKFGGGYYNMTAEALERVEIINIQMRHAV